jgi:hypothetical protein
MKMGVQVSPLTFPLSPAIGGEGGVRRKIEGFSCFLLRNQIALQPEVTQRFVFPDMLP